MTRRKRNKAKRIKRFIERVHGYTSYGGGNPYNRYMKSAIWKRRKIEFFKNHAKICMKCGINKYLNVHHGFYSDNNGKELDSELFVLCRDCHKLFHQIYGVKRNLLTKTKLFIEVVKSGAMTEL